MKQQEATTESKVNEAESPDSDVYVKKSSAVRTLVHCAQKNAVYNKEVTYESNYETINSQNGRYYNITTSRSS